MLSENLFLGPFQRIEFVEQAGGGEAERGGSLSRGPDVHQAVQHVFLALQTQFIARRTGIDRFAAAEPMAMVADHRLDRRQELGRRHQADRHPGPAKHRLDHLAVAVVGDDFAVLDRVAADDPAGRHPQAEDRIGGRGQLVHQFFRGRPRIEDTRIALFEDDHATAADPFVGAIHGRGDEVGEAHVGDESAAFVHLEQWFLTIRPLGDTDLAAEDIGFDADEGQRLGQSESAAPGGAILAGSRRCRLGHVGNALFGRTAFVNRRQSQVSRQAAGRGAGVDPGQFEGDHRQHQVLGSLDEAAFAGIHESRGDAGLIKGLEELSLAFVPVVGIACPLGHQPGDWSPGDAPGGLHQHLYIVPLGEAPHDLTNVVAGQGAQRLRSLFICQRGHDFFPF